MAPVLALGNRLEVADVDDEFCSRQVERHLQAVTIEDQVVGLDAEGLEVVAEHIQLAERFFS